MFETTLSNAILNNNSNNNCSNNNRNSNINNAIMIIMIKQRNTKPEDPNNEHY